MTIHTEINNNLFSQIDSQISISLAGLSGTVNLETVSPGAYRYNKLKFTGAKAGAVTIQFPTAASGFEWSIENASSGGNLLLKGGTATTLDVTFASVHYGVYYDVSSTNIENLDNASAGNFTVWSGSLFLARYGIATTQTDADINYNPVSATAGVPVQISPAKRYTGTAWDTGASASKAFNVRTDLVPISGNPATGYLRTLIDPGTGSYSVNPINLHSNGNVGLRGVTTPTAAIHYPAGTATAGTGPFKMTPGVDTTAAEIGNVEFAGKVITIVDNLATPVRQELVEAAYGSLYEDNPAGTALALTTAGTFYKWASSTANGVSKLITEAAAATSTLTIENGGDGVYEITFSASFAGDTTAQYHWQVHLNGSPLAGVASETNLTAGTNTKTACPPILQKRLVAGDVLDLRCSSSVNASTATIFHNGLSAKRIGRL